MPPVQAAGPAGSGQLTKMVNQICIAGIVQGMSEGFSFARAAGLDRGGGGSDLQGRGAKLADGEPLQDDGSAGEYNHGFAVEWMRKDLGIVLEEARRNGASLPVTALVDQFYAEVENMGGKRWDTSSLFARQEAHQARRDMNETVLKTRGAEISSRRSAQRSAGSRARHPGRGRACAR